MTKNIIAAAAIVILVAASARAQDTTTQNDSHFGRYLVGVATAQIADNITTQWAMRPYVDASGHVVAHGEFNPLLSSDRGANAIAQAGATVLALIVLHKIEPHHPKLARGIAIGLIGLGAQDSIHNVRTPLN